MFFDFLFFLFFLKKFGQFIVALRMNQVKLNNMCLCVKIKESLS